MRKTAIVAALCAALASVPRAARAGEGAEYVRTKLELSALLRKLEYDRSVLPQVEAKLTEAENKLYEDPPPKLAEEGRHLAEVKRNLQSYSKELPAYESVKGKLEAMLARVKAGNKIPSLHLRLAGIRRREVAKALTSPYMEFRKRELHDLMADISKASKEADEARKRGRIGSARQRREEEKRKKEEEEKRRLSEIEAARAKTRPARAIFVANFEGHAAGWEQGRRVKDGPSPAEGLRPAGGSLPGSRWAYESIFKPSEFFSRRVLLAAHLLWPKRSSIFETRRGLYVAFDYLVSGEADSPAMEVRLCVNVPGLGTNWTHQVRNVVKDRWSSAKLSVMEDFSNSAEPGRRMLEGGPVSYLSVGVGPGDAKLELRVDNVSIVEVGEAGGG